MAEKQATVRVIVFGEFNNPDGTRATATRMRKYGDRLLAHVEDPDKFFHQEINDVSFNVPESAVAPYLPIGKVWWIRYPKFADFVNPFARAGMGDPFMLNEHMQKALFLSRQSYEKVSGFQIRSVVPLEDPQDFDRPNIINLDRDWERMVYLPFPFSSTKTVGATTNPYAKRMEDWLSSHPDSEWLRRRNHAPDDGASYAITSEGNCAVVRASSDLRLALACSYDLIIDQFSSGFASARSKPKDKSGKVRYKSIIVDRDRREASYKWLWAFFHSTKKCRSCGEAHGTDDLPFNPSNMGLTLKQIHAFFKHFSVNLNIVDIAGRVDTSSSFRYEGTLNPHLFPHWTWAIQHNKHLYLLDQGIHSLDKLLEHGKALLNFPLRAEKWEIDVEKEMQPPSDRFPLASKPLPTQFIKSMADFPSIKTKVPIPDSDEFLKRIRVVVPANLWLLLSEIIIKCQYEPKVFRAGNRITGIELRLDGVSVLINQPDSPPGMAVPYIPTEATFNEYTKHDEILKNLLLNKQTLSTYSPSVLMAMRALDCSPLIFGRPHLVNGIARACDTTCYDINKAYTSFLREITHIPVFSVFDEIESFSYEPMPPTEAYATPEGSPAPAEEMDDITLKTAIHQWEARGDRQPVIRRRLLLEFGCGTDRTENLLTSPSERHGFYLVQVTNSLSPDEPEFLLLDQEYCLLTFENWLLVRDWPFVKTIGILRPSKLVEVDLAKPIADLWHSPGPTFGTNESLEQDTLPVALKKFLVNKTIGTCGKQSNKKSSTYIFKDRSEAEHYKKITKGEVIAYVLDGDKQLYFLTDERKARLKEGFYFTLHIVYNKQRKALYSIATLPQNKGRTIMAVKTDAIWFKGFTEGSEVAKDNSFAGIGKYEVSKNEPYLLKPATIKRFTEVDEVQPFGIDKEGVRLVFVSGGPPVQELAIANEFDATEFMGLFSNYNFLIVKGIIPGAGKSFALKRFFKEVVGVERSLIVTPWNALADENRVEGFKSITFHKLAGINIDGKGQRRYDISDIEAIFFDEVFLYDPWMLGHVRQFVQKNLLMEDGTERRFFGAGDPNQNQPIFNLLAQGDDAKAYYSKAVSSIFPNQITLRVCKRVKFKNPASEEQVEANEKQRELLTEIRNQVLNSDRPLLDIARSYFKPITTLEEAEGMAVCYTNKTANIVNNYKQSLLVKDMPAGTVKTYGGRTFYVGQRLRCRKYHNFGNADAPKLYVNYTYEVTGFAQDDKKRDGLKIKGSDGSETFITFALERTNFSYSHAHTCHSLQGSTATEGITLLDLDCWFVTREWFYTALTRADDLDKIFFFDGDLGSRAIKENEFLLKLRSRIQGHRYADEKAGRFYEEEDYVTEDDVRALIKASLKCFCCGIYLQLDSDGDDQLSLDRINNDLPHTKDNVRLSCLDCNRSRSNKAEN